MDKLLPLLPAVLSFSAVAGPYGPFEPNENYVVTLDGCKSTVEVRQIHPPLGTVDLSRADDEVTLRLTMVGLDHYVAQAFSNAEPRSQSVNVNVAATMPTDIGIATAVCDDLNGDRVTDFVVALWRHGNGLGASFYDRLVVLSSQKGYRYWVVPTMDPSSEDFVTFGTNEPIRLVTRQFVQKGDGDAERASYFVYDLWSFSGDEVATASSIDRRFPKWVRYTSEPNSTAASSLSEDDKRRLRSLPESVEAVP